MTAQEKFNQVAEISNFSGPFLEAHQNLFEFYNTYVFPYMSQRTNDPLVIEVIGAGLIGALDAVVLKELFPQALLHVSEPDEQMTPQARGISLFPRLAAILPGIVQDVEFSNDTIEDRLSKGIQADIVIFNNPGGSDTTGQEMNIGEMINNSASLVRSHGLLVSSSFDDYGIMVKQAIRRNSTLTSLVSQTIQPPLRILASDVNQVFVAQKK